MTRIQIQLPDALAQEAQAKGLLESDRVAAMLRRELDRQGTDRFFESLDRIASQPGEPMTPQEIEGEIAAARAARRRAD